MADACETLYAGLRAELLVRHFAVGRFWRVNQYDSEALLGEYRWPDGERRLPCGPLWDVPLRNGEPLYRSGEDLQHQEAERFRIAKPTAPTACSSRATARSATRWNIGSGISMQFD